MDYSSRLTEPLFNIWCSTFAEVGRREGNEGMGTNFAIRSFNCLSLILRLVLHFCVSKFLTLYQ